MGHSNSIPVKDTKQDNTNTTTTNNNNNNNNTTTTITTTTNKTNNTNKNTLPKKKTLSTSASKTTSPLPIASTSISKISKHNIIHDSTYCMFKMLLDTEGNTAALCYLPTRYKNIVEFYHIEIPFAYRNIGIGDILSNKAFEWVKKSNLMVIPTCPFVNKYLESNFPDRKSGHWSHILQK